MTTVSKLIIGNALLWAAIMIATSLIVADSNLNDKSSYALMVLHIAGWLVSNGTLISLSKKLTS